jgi:hypothetical protein
MKNMKEEDLQEKKEKEKEIINSLGFMAQCGLEFHQPHYGSGAF